MRNEFARRRAGGRPDQRVEHAFLGGQMRLGLDLLALVLARQIDRDLDQVAHDLLDIAADIADLGEFRRLDLHERRVGELGQPPRNLRLADAGRPDHQDVFRQHFLAHRAFELLAPPAVSERDRHRPLGILLPDDEAVEFGNDFSWREITGHRNLLLAQRRVFRLVGLRLEII